MPIKSRATYYRHKKHGNPNHENPPLTADAFCRRNKICRRTLSRYRKQGLVIYAANLWFWADSIKKDKKTGKSIDKWIKELEKGFIDEILMKYNDETDEVELKIDGEKIKWD